MSNDDLHGLAGAYAVDAVDDVERAQFEAHLIGCSACQSEVLSLGAAASELALGTVTSPPASLRESVLRSITSVRPLPPVVDAPEPPVSLESRRTERAERIQRTEKARRSPVRWLAGVAAAAVLATGGALWNPWSGEQEQSTVQLTATQRVLKAGDAQRFETKVGGATATVVRSPSLNRAVIVTANMPAPPKGKVYELWLQQGEDMVKAGFMPPGEANTVLLEGNAATAVGAGVTIEPVGGSATPSQPAVALISFA